MRSSFGRSRLVRQLATAAPLAADAGGMDVAERTSLWIGAFDAIRLQGVHRAVRATDAQQRMPLPAARARAERLADNLQRVRGALAAAIAREVEVDGTYGPWRQRHADLQRHMEQMVGNLREQVRDALAGVSPRMRQLAALDAAMQEVTAPREQALLPTALDLLQRNYEQRVAQDDEADAAFASGWREALRAEVDLRLEPVEGLVEALRKESDQEQ
ncbi:MAG TPA: DUF3348 family protein [Ramlibacter sp.]|nr:DUF3348 family protein [Ramlibacter sp.]